jgi:hypothetical protein
MNIKQTTFEYIGHGAPQTATLSEVDGVVVLKMWGGENTYTFQTIGMQSGDNTFSFVDASVDSPIEQELISFEDRGDDWESALRAVVEQLVKNRVAHTMIWNQRERTIAEDSERLIAEHVYKALLRQSGCCCPECDAEEPGRGAPDCSVCRHVLGELARVRQELAAGG